MHGYMKTKYEYACEYEDNMNMHVNMKTKYKYACEYEDKI